MIAMKKFLIASTLLLSLAACNSAEENVIDQVKTPELSVPVVDVDANRVLTMEIDGMVCQMGCGGSIRKELKATGGVSECEFDFEDGRKTNIATVAFDKELISADEIVAIVSKMNDKQFTVGQTSTESMEEIPGHENINETEETSTSDNESIVSVETSSFEFPNLLELVSNLLVH